MRFVALSLLGILGLAQAGTPGRAVPPNLISVVQQELEAGGGTSLHAAKLLSPVILQKGEILWRADFSKAGEAAWCGSGGCRMMLYVEDGENWRPVFDREVRAFSLKGNMLSVELYGRFCAMAGNAACHARYAWQADKRVWQPLGQAPLPIAEM